MGDRCSGLRNNNFFTLADAIEELNDVCGGFGKGDVGDHETQRCMRTIVILDFDCSAIVMRLFRSSSRRRSIVSPKV